MEKTKWHILSTRPLPAPLIAEAAARNFIIDEVSFIETKPTVDFTTSVRISQLFQKPITAVFTSANAVSAIAHSGTKPKGWKVYSLDNKRRGALPNN
ncbi:MAG TPA: hypothetical protein VM010_00145 [Chitinophagaceae bacterium]|nr:hypothetical protein [Chitinophagaceae bacterium]